MDSGASSTIEIAALGRPFSLGMLYDCRRDLLIPGMTLWDPEDLEKDTREKPAPNSEFEIVASESFEHKSSSLNVEASLKASFLGGLVEVGGSAKYLNDHKSSKNQARVTLKYKSTTNFQQLSMSHLGRGNMKHAFVFEKGLATHVVTGILCGAQAFFVFDRDVSEKEDHQDIEGNLKVMIRKIPCIAIEGEGSLKMEDKDRGKVEKFSCRFHGDFCLEKSPISFQDAIEVYKSLPTLLGVNGENAVPVKVWLLPLTSLDSSAAKLVRQISIRLVQESQSVLEDFSELEVRCKDAMRNTTAQQFPAIGKKIKTFIERCNEFQLEFQRTLSQKLPSIRGGGEEEAVLAEILKKRHSSPFNSKHLNEWMDCKEGEIRLLKSFTNMMKNTKIVPSQNDLHEETLSAKHAVCFVFTSLGSAEPYLSALSDYLKQTPKSDSPQNSHTHDMEKEQWYHSKNVSETMRKATLFRDFAEANKENQTIKFLTVGLTNETQKGSSIYLYKDGFKVNDNFEPPSKPETVTVSDIKHNNVSLNISPPRFGAENISSYSVEYCVSGEDGWQQKTETKSEVTVRDLSANTEYMFRCRGVTSVGVGPAVEVSGPIKTLPEDEDLLRNQITSIMSEPVCLIENSENGMRVLPQAMEILEQIDQPVVVVAIVGPSLTGKSYLMNRLAGKRKGFALGSTIQAQTKGIWMWCVPHPKKENHTLVLLDTEGFGDTDGLGDTEGLGDVDQGKKKKDTWLFVLAVLLSSTLVYNSMGDIGDYAMLRLQFVRELKHFIKVSRTHFWDESDEFVRFFPSFVWALRDFTLELVHDGKQITADQYLDYCLETSYSDFSIHHYVYNLTREYLRSYFPSRTCFVFDRPADSEKMRRMEDLSDADLVPSFVEQVSHFCDHITSESKTKTVGGFEMTGRQLGNLAKLYVEAISSGKRPRLESAVMELAPINFSVWLSEGKKN